MLIQLIFLIILSIALIFIQSKYLILVDSPESQKHKVLFNKNVPLSGGIYLFISILIFSFLGKFNFNSYIINLFLFFFLTLGIYSDIKTNFKPKFRLLLQLILIFSLVFFYDLKINKTNIFFIDYLIDNNFFNLIFTVFCIIVLLNGSNFCDGVNCNVIGHYLIVILSIYYSELQVSNSLLKAEIIIMIFLIFYIFNFFRKYFLGDSGVYVITIYMSIYVIEFVNINNNISSLIALNLLWYPAFENLFSIIRRSLSNRNIQLADRNHLHILIFEQLTKKNINQNFANTLTGISINFFLAIGIFASINFLNNSKVLILILLLNIIFYLLSFFYFLLKK